MSQPSRNLALLLLAFVLAESAHGQIPDLVESDPEAREQPIWISETFAKEDDDSVAWDLLGDSHLKKLIEDNNALYQRRKSERKSVGAAGLDECQIFASADLNEYNPGGTFTELVGRSTYIVTGTVIDSKQGFLYGSPGTVLEVSLDRAVKNPKGQPPPGRYLVFMSTAKIRTEGGFICATNSRRDQPPEKEARFLLFLFTEFFHNQESPIVIPVDKGVFYENPGAHLSLPLSFSQAKKEAYGFDRLVAKVTSLDQKRSEASQ